MKKSIIYLSTVILTFYSLPTEARAENAPVRIEMTGDSVAERNILTNRLEEIHSMDVSKMSRAEKRALRKEVRAIDKNLRDNYGGVYISVGGLIIIILLLIILL